MYFEAVVVVACLGIVVTGAPPPCSLSSPSRLPLGLPSAKEKPELESHQKRKEKEAQRPFLKRERRKVKAS